LIRNEAFGLDRIHGPWCDVHMTTKQKVLNAVRSLPADATVEDAMERILFLAKVERGIEQADAGKTLTHDKVRRRMAKWLK
jgi:predicted transcriptional regulator